MIHWSGLAASAAVERFTFTKQYLVDALIENVEIALGRRSVKIGADGVLTYVYRPEAVNTAIKMAAIEVGLFKDKPEITHRMNFDDLSDDQLLQKLKDETDALIREAEEDDELIPKLTSGRVAPLLE